MSGLLGAGVPLTNFSEETQKWWAQHQAVDAERQRREVAAQQVAQARAAALAKLTPEEQHLLGLGRA